MLEKIDFSAAKMTKEAYKPLKDELIKKLTVLQQQAHTQGIGVVCLIDGPAKSGRGRLASSVICRLDARYASVVTTPKYDENIAKALKEAGGVDGMYPLMKPFWDGLRARGEITMYDRGWYNYIAQKLIADYPKMSMKRLLKGKIPVEKIDRYLRATKHFEEQLANDGYIVLKFFLNITEKEQKKRLEELSADESTSWRVEDADWESVKDYERRQELYDALLEGTNYDFAPWILLNGEDRRRAHIRFLQALVTALDNALNAAIDPETAAAAKKAQENSAGNGIQVDKDERFRTPEENEEIRRANAEIAAYQKSLAPKSSAFEIEVDRPTLIGVDYHLHLPEGQYKKMLEEEQERFRDLEFQLYLQRKALILVYEGQDAAGKGSGYRRQVEVLDAKAYSVFTSPAPTKPELMHPFLWRYWALRMEKAGHVGIYDRSWYGRVLVERVEGFATPAQWARAYDEINQFEQDLTDWGAIVLKFWLEIDRDEQLRRFEARENTPEKQWKIVNDDWRNRDKYPQYREAAEDMFRLTSTKNAPWHLIEGNDKEYARIKMLRIINNELEKRLQQSDKK